MSLIETTAAAVAERFRELDLSDAAGLLLFPLGGGELAPLVLELLDGEVTPDVYRNGYQEEIGVPSVGPELTGRIEADDAYWLALAARVHALFGLPTLVLDIEMPIAEQLHRQLRTAPPDPLAGLDVHVAWRIDEQQIAAVWQHDTDLLGSARVPHEPWPIGWNDLLGSDPEVRAGRLPPGAVGARVGGHEARCSDRVWLCVLPQRAGRNDPPVVYLDVDGAEFPLAIDVDGLPRLRAADPDWDVEVEEQGRGLPSVLTRPLPGTVLGQTHGFGLRADAYGWSAKAFCGTFTVEVQGEGAPPSRLDLEAL